LNLLQEMNEKSVGGEQWAFIQSFIVTSGHFKGVDSTMEARCRAALFRLAL